MSDNKEEPDEKEQTQHSMTYSKLFIISNNLFFGGYKNT